MKLVSSWNAPIRTVRGKRVMRNTTDWLKDDVALTVDEAEAFANHLLRAVAVVKTKGHDHMLPFRFVDMAPFERRALLVYGADTPDEMRAFADLLESETVAPT